jgi:hypothetical protein
VASERGGFLKVFSQPDGKFHMGRLCSQMFSQKQLSLIFQKTGFLKFDDHNPNQVDSKQPLVTEVSIQVSKYLLSNCYTQTTLLGILRDSKTKSLDLCL